MKSMQEIFVEPDIANSFSIERFNKFVVDGEISNRLSDHRILLIESGRGKLNIDNNSFEIKSHEVFLMSKEQVYKFENSSIISGYNISFGDCFWEKTPKSASNCKAVLFNNTVANQLLQLDSSEMGELSSLSDIVLNEFRIPKYINQLDALAAYLKIKMIKLANVKLTEDTTIDNQAYLIYRKFLELLSADYRNSHSVNIYAEILSITPRRLGEICRRCCEMDS